MMAYNDHVAVVRFTPRDLPSTDAEIFWLVHPDAKEGKDYDPKRLQALWGNTYREDRWICENQQFGVMSSRYNFGGGQPYAAQEGGPASVRPVVHAGSGSHARRQADRRAVVAESGSGFRVLGSRLIRGTQHSEP